MASPAKNISLSSDDQGHLLIRASAGTGKTYQLSSRYLRLLFDGTEIDQILATTFTRKAAGEILTRVLHWVAEAAINDDVRDNLARALHREELSVDHCITQLRQLVRQLHRMRIATLDSFFINLASGFELELGLPPNWSICDPVDEPMFRTRALARMLSGREADAAQWVHLLAKGAAKRSVHDLLLKTVNEAHSIYCETPPEAWQTIRAPLPLSDDDVRDAIDRLKQVAIPENKSIQKAHATSIEHAENANWSGFVAGGIARRLVENASDYYRWTIDELVSGAYEPLVRHSRSVLISEVIWQTETAYELLKRFDHYFRQLQSEMGIVRFSDVPPAIVALMSQDQDRRLAHRMGGRINHLLLDEFQDTSLVQWRSLEPISRRIVKSSGLEHSLFCVGDTKQAIYGWRGGMVEIFDHLETNLPQLHRMSLTDSFRSSPAVIDTVNRLFQGMTRHNNLEECEPGIRKWCAAFETHSTKRSNLPGYACVITTAEPDPEEKNQAELVLEATIEQVKQLWHAAPEKSIAILTRSNSPISSYIYHLRQQGIPASEEGGNPLTDSAAVQIILSLLQLADHPSDTIAQFHVAHSPLAPLLDWNPACVGQQSLAASLALRTRRRLMYRGYGASVAEWAQALRASCTRREWDRLQQLVEMAYRYDQRATLRATDFIDMIMSQRVADPTSASVRVMTIHQAKGLEFDIVLFSELTGKLHSSNKDFVVAWDATTLQATHVARFVGKDTQALMPEEIRNVYAQALERDLGEALCVLYVAVTRAKHALYLVTPPRLPNTKGVVDHLRSYSGLVHAGLVGNGPMDAESVVYETGDPTWFRQLEVEPTAAIDEGPELAVTSEPDVRNTSISLAPVSATRVHGLESVAPSSLEGGARCRLSDIVAAERSESLDYGTLVHAWFESVEWIDQADVTDEALRAIAERLARLSPQRLERAIENFHTMIAAPRLRQLLTRASYETGVERVWPVEVSQELDRGPVEWEVKRETRIMSRDGDRVLMGNVDRLVLARRDGRPVAADIIDFKTDGIASPEELEQRVAYYRPQMHAYRRAISRMLRLSPGRVAARLVFVQCDTWVAIE